MGQYPIRLAAGSYLLTITVTNLHTAGRNGLSAELVRTVADGPSSRNEVLTTFSGKLVGACYSRRVPLHLERAEHFDLWGRCLEGGTFDFDVLIEPAVESVPMASGPTLEEIAVKLLAGYVTTVADWNSVSAKVRVDRCFDLAREVIRRRGA